MKKTIILIGICLLTIVSFFSGCFNIPKELTQFSIMSFDVDPSIISQGEYANLSWIVLSASTVTIDKRNCNVALTGHRMIQPIQTTTYTLTASNATTTKTATAIVTVKPIQQTPSQQTLNITCSIDNISNRIIIASVDTNVKWSDIAITTNTNASWQVQDINKKDLGRIGITSTIATNINVNDSILLLDSIGDVTVTLKYIPTNTILGTWTINVKLL